MTTRVTSSRSHQRHNRKTSFVGSGQTRPSSRIPALASASTHSVPSRGLCLSFHASACSRPPVPRSNTLTVFGQRKLGVEEDIERNSWLWGRSDARESDEGRGVTRRDTVSSNPVRLRSPLSRSEGARKLGTIHDPQLLIVPASVLPTSREFDVRRFNVRGDQRDSRAVA